MYLSLLRGMTFCYLYLGNFIVGFQNDGPPPDPSYRFLSDPDRDGIGDDRDSRRERGKGGKGRGRGRRGGRGRGGRGGGAWEGSDDGEKDGVSDRDQKSFGRGNNFSDEDHSKRETVQNSGDFGGQGSKGFSRQGRGRSSGNFGSVNDEHEYWQGQGRKREHHGTRQQNENLGSQQQGPDSSITKDGTAEEGGRGHLSFASRDIRYYSDNAGDSVNERSGRGRENYSQYHSHDNHNDFGRQRERGRGRGNFRQRGRGRGRVSASVSTRKLAETSSYLKCLASPGSFQLEGGWWL